VQPLEQPGKLDVNSFLSQKGRKENKEKEVDVINSSVSRIHVVSRVISASPGSTKERTESNSLVSPCWGLPEKFG
jgi:hypothetical protein